MEKFQDLLARMFEPPLEGVLVHTIASVASHVIRDTKLAQRYHQVMQRAHQLGELEQIAKCS